MTTTPPLPDSPASPAAALRARTRPLITGPTGPTDLRLSMQFGAHGLQLGVGGTLDLATCTRLDAALHLLDRSPFPGAVDLSAVGFADSTGLEPLATAARRRARTHRAPSRLLTPSPPVRLVLDALHVAWDPSFDVAAWDAHAETDQTDQTGMSV